MTKTTKQRKGLVVIDEARCKGCGICVSFCNHQVLGLSVDRLNSAGYHPIEAVNMDVCTGCGICAAMCPDVVFGVYRAKAETRETPQI